MIVGVMASSKEAIAKKHSSLAKTVGAVVATHGFDLLTGGGRGLMQAVGEEFLKIKPRTGKLISVLRADGRSHLSGRWDDKGNLEAPEPRTTKRIWKANQDNDLAEVRIRTHLPYSGALGDHDLSRNHINILTSDLIVVLPGEVGTFSELRLAWEYDKPIMIFLGDDGTVDGKTAEEIKAEFSGVTLADAEDGLRNWLFERVQLHPR